MYLADRAGEPWLRQYQVQTLVIVPDGVLRLIPLGALYDGEHYLIERYAIATFPVLPCSKPRLCSNMGSPRCWSE